MKQARQARWLSVAESGTARAMRVGAFLARWIGPRATSLLLWPVAAYFAWRNRPARQGSLQYLERVHASPEGRAALGRRPGTKAVVRHLHEFALSLHDRLLVWCGQLERMQVEHDGSGKIFELAGSGRGGLLLGAHLGSLDMLSFLSRKYKLTVNVVAFFENARRINEFFESLAPDHDLRLIELDPGCVQAAFRVRACIERGEFVVILADRVTPGSRARTAEVQFLGRPTRFPLEPFLLGGVLGCPVSLVLCLRLGPSHYRTVLRPLWDGAAVARGERDKHARELLERYVGLLETQCVQMPYQWFNFYEFWSRP